MNISNCARGKLSQSHSKPDRRRARLVCPVANSKARIIVWLAAVLSVSSAYWGPDLPKGPYCGIDNRCCKDREDGCSHRILGTLCYCDEFCNRTPDFDDCCPDYAAVCLHELPPPEPLYELKCYHKGKMHLGANPWMENCNECDGIQNQIVAVFLVMTKFMKVGSRLRSLRKMCDRNENVPVHPDVHTA
ncbi:Tubulointerstitial nephritis antigen-like [Eumeta japonica]|uniref:Tubulointerstitial nephritis antigen-like n=1 Tax=Eumeta variegata TaxID=151549 RepID=A0A4C1UEZ5_EUMVA|nr:Tubulointerstitial nephritis antigen-like [Eumeta japonica]